MMDGDQLSLATEVLPPGELSDDEFLAQAEGQIRGYGKLVVSGIVEIGRKLVEVKGRVGYSGFVVFVTERLSWSERAGNRFVSVAEMFTTANLAVDDLSIDASSLYLIAAPSTPAEVRGKVLEQAAEPEGISRAQVEKLVTAARQQQAEADRTTLDATIAEHHRTLDAKIAAIRDEYAGKLVLDPDELVRRIDAAAEPIRKNIEQLTAQRDAARETVAKLQAAAAEPRPDQPPPIDGTISFQAMCIRQAVSALKEALRITPQQYLEIEREVATRAHSRSADPEIAATCLHAAAITAWLGDLVKSAEG